VSTDDDEIARVAREFGAEVPFRRPAEFAGDRSTDLEVFRHALEWLRDEEGYTPDLVVHLRATGPVRRVALIDRAIDTMLAHPAADSLRSVSTPVQSPYKMWRLAGDRMEPLLRLPGIQEAHSSPRQGLPAVYWQNGYVDIVRPRVVLERGLMAGDHVLPFVIEEPVLELDYPEAIPEIEAALSALERGEWPAVAGPAGARHPV
jgi:CMP-N,N'-diacetyllegionaminic acid synthase